MDAVGPEGRYLALVEAGDRDGAIDFVLSLLEAGLSLAGLVRSVLGPAQVEVGRRWEINDLTVAEEHAASGICDAVFAVVAAEARRRGRRPARDGPRIVAACVEDEWHVLPLRMSAEVMTCVGADMTFLGPSIPPSHLSSYLEVARPDACALSCTVASHLPSLRRCIDAAHAAGIPVIAGGRALGGGAARAEHLDADAWTNEALAAVAVARRWAGRPPEIRRPPIGGGAMQTAQLEVAILERPTAHRIDTVMDGLLLRYPPLASYSAAQLERTREDVAHILRHAAAALVVDDPTLFVDFTEWMLRVLASRDVAPAVIRAGYQAIREVCGEELPNAALLLESAENLLP